MPRQNKQQAKGPGPRKRLSILLSELQYHEEMLRVDAYILKAGQRKCAQLREQIKALEILIGKKGKQKPEEGKDDDRTEQLPLC